MGTHNRLTCKVSFLTILGVLVLLIFAPASWAQAYLYGRADFPLPNFVNDSGIVIVADFNGDGQPDLAVSDFNNNWVSILLGTSGGGFVPNGTYSTGHTPGALVAADFNGDRKLDLAVVNRNDGTVSILLGNGDGTFQSHVDYPVGLSPSGIVAADFNGDGKIDLATISTGDSAVAILLGDGKGGFEVQALVPVASSPDILVGGDVNGDGKTDLITCNNNFNFGPTITVLLNNGHATFTQVQSQAPSFAQAIAVGDFNRDGKPDVVTVANGLFLSLGNGDGSFQNPVSIPNAPQLPCCNALSVLAADFNHDHKLDIAVSGIWVMLGNGDGTFQNPVMSPATTSPFAMTDVNGDGELDIVGITSSGTIGVLLGNGDGSFMDLRTITLASTSSSGSNPGVVADFNGDGKLDLAVAEGSFSNGQISVELGKGKGDFGQPVVSPLGTSASNPNFMVAADFNGDQRTDLVVTDNNGNGFEVLLGNGDGSFGTPVDTPLTYSVNTLAVGDFNKDGKADVVVTTNNNNSTSMNIFLGNGDGTFSPGAQYALPVSSSVVVADVNGDGNPDLIVIPTNQTFQCGFNLLVYLGNGDGSFKIPIPAAGDCYLSAVVEDFDGDGKLDIAASTFSHGIAFLAGDGDGTFQSPIYSNPGIVWTSLITGDFDGDRKLDLAGLGGSSFNSPALEIMQGNGDGGFGPPLEFDVSGQVPQNLLGGDFNSDGVSDFGIPSQNFNANPLVLLYVSTPSPKIVPTALNFGSVPVGKTSPPKKVQLTNAGNSKLKISRIAVSGDFLEQNDCGKQLGIGKACTIQVSFKPQSKGPLTGELSIVDNAPGRQQKVSLKGVGAAVRMKAVVIQTRGEGPSETAGIRKTGDTGDFAH